MAIPGSQLDTWCNQGATESARATYASIQAALGDIRSSVRFKDYETYLQGSYRNDTSIYGDSDVDIVAQLNSTYTFDSSSLNLYQRAYVEQGGAQANYTCQMFRSDVLKSLIAYYGVSRVRDCNKCIRVSPGSGRLDADVVPAIKHKLYTPDGMTLLTSPGVIEGIKFWDKSWREIINYPKEHIRNGQAKNGLFRANGEYKPIVRMFKNARTYLEGNGRIANNLAPSYFLECLLYNVPDSLFVANRQQAMRGILEWLRNANMTPFMSQNNVVRLFGPTQEQWNEIDAKLLLLALINLWNDWPI